VPRCNRCGVESPEGARFCVACGGTLQEEAAPAPPPRPEAGPSPEDLAAADRLLTEAFALSDQGRLTEAVRVAQQVLSHNPNSTTAHSLLGTLYERLGNRDAAIREYQAVLTLSPGSTADRQRLNELLGLPAAPAAARPPLPRLARRPDLLYVGGFAALFIVILIAILILLRKSPRAEDTEPTAGLSRAPARAAYRPPEVGGAVSYPSLPTPGLPTQPSLPEPAPTPSPPSFTSLPSPAAPSPEELEEPRQVIVLPFPGYTPPQEPPARFLPGGGMILSAPPLVRTPLPLSETGALAPGIQPNVMLARQFVVTGRLQEAKEVYEATLTSHPVTSPRLREELATVYFRLGQPNRAALQYLRAYGLYQEQLERGAEGVEAEAARHGLATCQAALHALGVETP